MLPQFAVKLVIVTLVAALAEGAGDGVGVGVGVAVGVGVGVGVGRGLGAAERLPSTIRPHAPAAKNAIAMSRLIPRKKGLAVMLEELVHITDLSVVKCSLGVGESCLAFRDFSSLRTHFRGPLTVIDCASILGSGF